MQYQVTMWSCVYDNHSFWQYFPGGRANSCYFLGKYLNIWQYNLVKNWHAGSNDFQERGKVESVSLKFWL